MQLRDDARVRHDARVGGEHTRHVLPERDLPRAQRAGEQRGREVRAATPQRDRLSVRSGAEEAGNDGDDAAGEQRAEHAARAALGASEIG